MDNKFVGLLSIFFLVFGVFISVLFFNKNITTFTRAKEELIPVKEKSILLGYPLTVTADNQTTSTITAWVRNEKGIGIADKNVTLTSTLGTIDQPTQKTDKDGRISFKIKSSTPGDAVISAMIENSIPSSNSVTINFVSQ
ncbi:MAG TPA: Ig-like domain-containing protein [Candidatus Nitrosocosmicus sp.]|nr:Ig-like domain-containing protein [Candidatus Nitrosocosmicus sp.]